MRPLQSEFQKASDVVGVSRMRGTRNGPWFCFAGLERWLRVAALADNAWTEVAVENFERRLRVWTALTLGRMYNVSSAFGNRLYTDQELVTTGPFALVRHPMYVGALIAGVGGVLLYRTWSAVLILTHEAVFWVRAGREEQVLAEEFGDAWRAYARHVAAGVPVLRGPRVD